MKDGCAQAFTKNPQKWYSQCIIITSLWELWKFHVAHRKVYSYKTKFYPKSTSCSKNCFLLIEKYNRRNEWGFEIHESSLTNKCNLQKTTFTFCLVFFVRLDINYILNKLTNKLDNNFGILYTKVRWFCSQSICM